MVAHRLREKTLRYEVVREVEVVRPKGGDRWQEEKGVSHAAQLSNVEVGTLLGTHVCLLCGDQLFQVSH